MRLRIKADLCQGHALCRLAFPELIQLGEDDGHAFVPDGNVPPDMEAKARRAQKTCPEGAVQILTK